MHKLILGTFLVAEAVLVVFLTGCGATFDYKGLKAENFEGDGFNRVLAREYREFSVFESDEMADWPDAAHFGEKALAAAVGTAPLPEKLKDWRLPKDKIGEMTAARVRLVEALDKGAGERWPEMTARAQTRFDCWIEQQEENWQTEHIAFCRDGFMTTIVELDKALAVSEAAADTAAIPAVADAAQGVDAGAADPKSYLILFEFDSDLLTPQDHEALAAIVEQAGNGDAVRIIVSGHADRAGPEPYNQGLSWRRAKAVGDALIDRGVEAGRISLNAHGEKRPLVATPDGMREARNRRVEVTVGPAPEL
ncbi:MAG: OmpA family protein [Rhodospirillales bacterium]|nr:OmpA family protein [Rhodospirillales bacterium]